MEFPHACGVYVPMSAFGCTPHRFIPTHVGFTISSLPASADKSGSSPRMWGLRIHDDLTVSIRRFIPTHVGFTGRARSDPSKLPVHPHACGVYACASFLRANHDGSSPHMWGLHLGYMLAPQMQMPVHPHTCGVYHDEICLQLHQSGSSPHMWGLRSYTGFSHVPPSVHPHTCGVYGGNHGLEVCPARFIPTHVGFT